MKKHIYMTLRRDDNMENQIRKFLLEYIKLNVRYGVYFKDEQIEYPFLKLTIKLFKSEVTFVKTKYFPLFQNQNFWNI